MVNKKQEPDFHTYLLHHNILWTSLYNIVDGILNRLTMQYIMKLNKSSKRGQQDWEYKLGKIFIKNEARKKHIKISEMIQIN